MRHLSFRTSWSMHLIFSNLCNSNYCPSRSHLPSLSIFTLSSPSLFLLATFLFCLALHTSDPHLIFSFHVRFYCLFVLFISVLTFIFTFFSATDINKLFRDRFEIVPNVILTLSIAFDKSFLQLKLILLYFKKERHFFFVNFISLKTKIIPCKPCFGSCVKNQIFGEKSFLWF